jgi:hypothetical protein
MEVAVFVAVKGTCALIAATVGKAIQMDMERSNAGYEQAQQDQEEYPEQHETPRAKRTSGRDNTTTNDGMPILIV